MLETKFLAVFLLSAMAFSTATCNIVASHYEEMMTYAKNPHCKPSNLDKGVKCSAIGSPIEVKGGLYLKRATNYVPMASAYYVARMADAMGYQANCPTNKTFLKQLNLQNPWSGTHGAIGIDGAFDFERVILRICKFPTATVNYYLCKGAERNVGIYGKRLEGLSYVSVLQGANLRWTLFIQCWGAQTPEDPTSEGVATSFNVFNLDPTFSAIDRALVIAELKKRGFNTNKSNIVEFDYNTNDALNVIKKLL